MLQLDSVSLCEFPFLSLFTIPFHPQDKELLYCSSPCVGITTFGCFTSRKAYFDSWHSRYSSNNLEATEHYTSSKPRRHTKPHPYIHAGANHKTFHFHFFSSCSNLTPPILYVWYAVPTRGEEAQLCVYGERRLQPGVWERRARIPATHLTTPCPGPPAQLGGRADALNGCCWHTEPSSVGETGLLPSKGTTSSCWGLNGTHKNAEV